MSDVLTAAGTPAPAKKPMHPKKKKVLKTVAALAVAAAIFGGGGFGLYRFLSDDDTVSEIYSQPAMMGSIQSTVSGSGTAMAKESTAITLTQGGLVQEVYVTAGDIVSAGQPLYSIYSQAAQDEVTLAQEQVNKLNEELVRLYEDMDSLTIRAPFSGKLQDAARFQLDEYVAGGAAVATLVNDRQLRLSVYFSYAYEQDIQVGQSVSVSVPVVMGTFTGRVEDIHKVSYISPEGGVHFEAVVVFDNPGTLTAGMDASVTLTAADGSAIYPYANAKLEFYETRTISTKTAGPVEGVGNLLNHANVEAGEALLYLGSENLDDEIRAKQTELEQAELKLQEAMEALGNFNAVAPIDGTVTSCTLNEGAEVKAGETVIIISNNTTMVVTIQVDNANISFIKPGSFVNLDWNGMMYQGVVTAIDMAGAQIGSGMTNYPVTLSVDNFDGSLMDGAWLTYSFVTSQSDDCILIPTSAVKYVSDMEGNRQAVVFVRRDSKPEDTPELDLPEVQEYEQKRFPSEDEGFYPVVVETGISDPQNVEILSGIQDGDEVFVNYSVTTSGSSWG